MDREIASYTAATVRRYGESAMHTIQATFSPI
jgi:hypothetical protein